MVKGLAWFSLCSWALISSPLAAEEEKGLVGHWKLAGDAGFFDGKKKVIETPTSKDLHLGAGDFSISLWVNTDAELDDVLGDLVSKYDPVKRRGFNLGILTNNVTGSQPNHRHIHFGIDNGKTASDWTDCGKPGNAILIFALAVHEGQLYAGTCEAGKEEAGHVFRYQGGSRWTDCGNPDKCNSVSSLAVFQGKLYAGVSKYRLGGSALAESENPNLGGKIYRYEGDKKWADCGKLTDAQAVNGLAIYKGKLYASSLYSPGLFRYDGDKTWTSCGSPDGKRVEALAVYNGSLYATSYDGGFIYRYEGENAWTNLGRLGENTQTYSFAIHEGQMYVGTWPSGKVYRYGGGTNWIDAGRLGSELEVMGMAVYNGKFYAGTLPLAEVFRFDGGVNWTKVGRLDQTPDVKYRRVWSMAVFQGKLFAGTLPSGKVFAFEAGKNVTHDYELAPGWKHLAAVREGSRLKLYVEGKLAASSSSFQAEDYDLTNDQPLKIGFGPTDYFKGKLRDVRIYRRALTAQEVGKLGSN